MKRTILLLLLLISLNQVKSQSFILSDNTLFPLSYSSSDVGDYDNDGDIDIIISGGTSGFSNGEKYTKIFDNDGHGQFSENQKNSFVGLIKSSVAWGDFNNDKLLDFCICGNDYYPFGSNFMGMNRCTTKVYKNNGNGNFEDLNAQITGLTSGHISWSDLNNDGYLDIVINGSTDVWGLPTTKIYRNNTNSTFTEMPTTITGTKNGDSRCIDFNNDGLPDIIVSGQYKDSVLSDGVKKAIGITKVFNNLGNFSFSSNSNNFPPMIQGRSKVSDFNKDGYKDFVIADGFNIYIYKNDTKGSFIQITPNIQPYSVMNELNVGDFNSDGFPDVFLSGVIEGTYSIDAKLYFNNGDMTFRESDFKFPSILFGTSNHADFNNDGKLDLFYTGGTDPYTYGGDPIAKIYINNMSNTGLSDSKYSNTNIYPNPSKNKIHIKSNEKLNEISIYNLDGKLLLQRHLDNENEINISSLSNGIYNVKVITESGIFQQKLIKE